MFDWRWGIAAVALGGVLAWLVFGEHKGVALAVSLPVVLICRWLVLPREEADPLAPDDADE